MSDAELVRCTSDWS